MVEKPSKNMRIESLLEKNTLNIVFYDDSFIKTRFFSKLISKWDTSVFYFDFDLLYSGYVLAGQTQVNKNLTVLSPDNDSLREDLRTVIEEASKSKSLIILDSLNGFFNLFEGEKDVGRIINSFIMLLVSTIKNTKSSVFIGGLSKLNDENEWVLYNTGRHVIENCHLTKIQLIRTENSILTKVLNSDNSSNSHLIL